MGASFSLRPSFQQAIDPRPRPSTRVTPTCPQVSQPVGHSAHHVEVAKVNCPCPEPVADHTDHNSQVVTTNYKPPQPDIANRAPLSPLHDVGLPTAPNSPVPLFALIIGIDDYTHCRKLRGAVADAKAVKAYLEEVLCVSEDHIRTLLDHHATRDAIIKAFEDLQNDDHIKKGDPILVFYAGHGGELPAPPVWGTENKIQCLLPRDYRPGSIHPIPDRTIGALLNSIARLKGDNITVIFDCCHSASGTRPHSAGYVPRSVHLDCSIPPDLDLDIWRSRAGAIPDGFAHHGLRSHVLMAACGEKELAFEHDGRGQFTSALLSVLQVRAVNSLTYAQVLQRIHLPNPFRQTPHCEGYNRHRILFNARVLPDGQVRHPVRVDNCRTHIIGAGLAHGVTSRVEFTLYNDRSSALGVVIVDDSAVIEDFQTTLTTSEHLASASFAKLTRVGNVPLRLIHGGSLYPVLKDTLEKIGGAQSSPNFRLVDEVEEARLQVTLEGNRVTFNVFDQRVNYFGLTKLPRMTSLDNLARVLDAAARYYWYLDLANSNNPTGITHDVSVDFYLLKWEYDGYGVPLCVPVEPGYCLKDPNSPGSDVIDFVVDPKAVYGIKITNNTSWDLYVNAFLFNTSSLSIASYYTQPGAGGSDAPLKRNGTFTIGYGPGGITPFSYWMEESQDIDVGYLKIFFATRPIDMSDVVQKSPFLSGISGRNEAVMDYDDARKAKLSVSSGKPAPSLPGDTWFTVQIPIVQRRRAN